jgi:hypothetical protein
MVLSMLLSGEQYITEVVWTHWYLDLHADIYCVGRWWVSCYKNRGMHWGKRHTAYFATVTRDCLAYPPTCLSGTWAVTATTSMGVSYGTYLKPIFPIVFILTSL